MSPTTYNLLSQRLTSFALFGQTEYLFSPHWRGTLGLRVTHDEKTFNSQSYLVEEGDFVSTDTVYNPPLLTADFSSATVGGLAKESNTYLSGKVQIDYIVTKDNLIYASVSRGVKGAGFNGNVTGATPNDAIPFRGEHMFAYELGNKLTLLNDRLTVDSAAFYYDYKDFQAYQLGRGFAPFVSNNSARFYGGEIEVAARPIRQLEIRLGLSALNTVVYNVATAQIGVIDQLASDAPKYSGNGLVRYTWGIGEGEAGVQWSTDFLTSRYHSVDNTPDALIHGSSGSNARIGYTLHNWDFSVYANNVLNNVRQTAAYDNTASGGYAIATYMPPRWWGATVRYKW